MLLGNFPILPLQGGLLELFLQPGPPHFHVEDVRVHHVERQRASVHELVTPPRADARCHENSGHRNERERGRGHDRQAQRSHVAARAHVGRSSLNVLGDLQSHASQPSLCGRGADRHNGNSLGKQMKRTHTLRLDIGRLHTLALAHLALHTCTYPLVLRHLALRLCLK